MLHWVSCTFGTQRIEVTSNTSKNQHFLSCPEYSKENSPQSARKWWVPGWEGTAVFHKPCKEALHLGSKAWATFHLEVSSRISIGAQTRFCEIYLQLRPMSLILGRIKVLKRHSVLCWAVSQEPPLFKKGSQYCGTFSIINHKSWNQLPRDTWLLLPWRCTQNGRKILSSSRASRTVFSQAFWPDHSAVMCVWGAWVSMGTGVCPVFYQLKTENVRAGGNTRNCVIQFPYFRDEKLQPPPKKGGAITWWN